MFPTHIMKGLVLISPLLYIYPELSDPIILCTIIGFSIPDLDIIAFQHRRTLHYPLLGFLPYIFSISLFLLTSSEFFLFASILFFSIHIHAISDIFGGSLEPEPWEQNDERAVYNHLKSNWIKPLRLVQHDGSKGDLVLYFILLTIFLFAKPIEFEMYHIVLIFILSVIAIIYTSLRKTIFSPVYMENNHPNIKKVFDSVIN